MPAAPLITPVRIRCALAASEASIRLSCAPDTHTGGCFVLETLHTAFSSRFIILSRKVGWVIRCVSHVYSSSQMYHFGYIQRAGFALEEEKKTGLGHRFGAAMKVNENRHLGSSAFDPPPA